MEQLSYSLDLSLSGPGFSIVGGYDPQEPTGDHAIILSAVQEHGAASRAGLQVGDQLIAVNGFPLGAETSHEEAVSIVKQAIMSRVMKVTISRPSSLRDVVVSDISSVPLVDTNEHGAQRMKLAKKAYKQGDPELSKRAHELGQATEQHMGEAGTYVKAAVFGGLDGIITTFAVVASVAGANLSVGVVIIMGFANLIADGFSMGMGEYLSAKSESEYVMTERQREEWEMDNNPEGEIQEMIDLYKAKGFSEDDANAILRIMSKKREFFIDHMMIQELGLMPVDEDENPAKAGLVMFCAFICFGLVPLLSYLAFSTVEFDDQASSLFGIAIALTACALFALGAIKSKFSTQTWYYSGFMVLLNGGIAAAASYLVGFLLEKAVNTDE